MKKWMLILPAAALLALGAWLLWPEKPGLPDSRDWELLEQEPATMDTAADILDSAQWTKTMFITEGELRGGAPSGETLTVRWGGKWLVPGVALQLAWEASWSETPSRDTDRLSFVWHCTDQAGKTVGVFGQGLWAAAQKDGLYYRLNRGLIWPEGVYWPMPRQADVSRGWIELQTGDRSFSLYHADLTMTYTAGEIAFTDTCQMDWDGEL